MSLSNEENTAAQPVVVPQPTALPVDPLPWVHHYDPTDRAPFDTLPGGLQDFKPRDGYEQDPAKYRFNGRL